jgi:hypothetical protein
MLQLIAGNIYRYVTKCEEHKIHGNYSTLTYQSSVLQLEPVLSLIVIFSQVDDSLHHDDYYKFVVVLKT